MKKKKRNMKFWNKDWNIPAFLIVNIVLFSLLFYYDLNRKVDIDTIESIGTITFKFNHIERKYDSQVIWRSLETNSEIKNRDIIRTFENSDAVIKLKDGTEIHLDENSMIYLDLLDSVPNIGFENGSMRVLNQARDENGNVKVKAGQNATITLTGNARLDKSSNDEYNLSIETGKATLERDGNKQVIDKNNNASITSTSVNTFKSAIILNSPENQKKIPTTSSDTPIIFNWASINANEFKLEISLSRNFTSPIKTLTTSANSASVTLKTGSYYWRVGRINQESNKYEYSETRKILLYKENLFQTYSPENGKVFSTANAKSIKFSWSAINTASSYFLEIAKDSAFSSPKTIQLSTTSYTVNDLKPGNYFWKVTPKSNLADISFSPSAVSSFTVGSGEKEETKEVKKVKEEEAKESKNVKEDETKHSDNKLKETEVHPKNKQEILLSEDITKNNILLQWAHKSNVESYKIQVSKNSSFNPVLINKTSVDSNLYIENIKESGTYYWRYAPIIKGKLQAYSQFYQFTLKNMNEPIQKEPVKEVKKETPPVTPVKKEIAKKDLIESFTPKVIYPNNTVIDPEKSGNIVFKWDRVKNAKHYELRLLQVNGHKEKEVFSSKTSSTEARLKNLTKLNESKFKWTVTAFDDKNHHSHSGNGAFTIKLKNEKLKKLKPEEIKIISPDTFYKE